MAILYHEGYWLRHYDASYSNVVAIEGAFQAFLESQTPVNAARWTKLENFQNGLLRASIQADQASGALGPLLRNSRYISTIDLFGSTYMGCALKTQSGCLPFATMYVLGLRKQYPTSLFLKYVAEKLQSGTDAIRITLFQNGSGGGGIFGFGPEFPAAGEYFSFAWIDLGEIVCFEQISGNKNQSEDESPTLWIRLPPRAHLEKYSGWEKHLTMGLIFSPERKP